MSRFIRLSDGTRIDPIGVVQWLMVAFVVGGLIYKVIF